MFKNRREAGRRLAEKLKSFSGKKEGLILGVTRGGVVVAKIIADRLNLPLDIITIKKIGFPRQMELAIGAVGPQKTAYRNESLLKELNINQSEMLKLESEKQTEQEEQEKILRHGKLPKDLKGKTVIVVDDGVATGASVICAADYLQKVGVDRKILATPIISKDTMKYISKYFDMVISLKISGEFSSVGGFYSEFPQVENKEVIKLLR